LSTTDVALNHTAQAAKDANKLNETALRPWVDFDIIEPFAGFTATRDTVTFWYKIFAKKYRKIAFYAN